MKKVSKSQNQSVKGFSLVEIIVVVAIIIILASAVLFNYLGVFKNAINTLDAAFCCDSETT